MARILHLLRDRGSRPIARKEEPIRIIRNIRRQGLRAQATQAGAAVYAPEFYVWDRNPRVAKQWAEELLAARDADARP